MLLLEPKTGSIIDANNSAIKFYGYDKAKLCSMKMDDINILSAKQVLTERTKAKEEERNYFWFSHKTANDEVRAVEVHSSFITFNNQQILFSIIYDVTDRKKAKQALLKSEQQQKELNATKDKLFSIISHDLRSPFNSIIGLSDLLTDSTENQSVEDSKVIVKMINSSSKSALILLDNLLDWARSQTGQISFNPINLNLKLIIIETFELLKPTAQIKNIALKYNQYTDFEVYADENMLKIILHNLISNGIKFNNTNGKIDIYTEQKQNGIEITVSDNGVGISKDIQSMLFNVYKNTTTRGTSNEKGSGLGLLICKEFLDKHNGHIWAESELGKGSTIKFILPYKI
jgi:PAS domain S-box-containing protein